MNAQISARQIFSYELSRVRAHIRDSLEISQGELTSVFNSSTGEMFESAADLFNAIQKSMFHRLFHINILAHVKIVTDHGMTIELSPTEVYSSYVGDAADIFTHEQLKQIFPNLDTKDKSIEPSIICIKRADTNHSILNAGFSIVDLDRHALFLDTKAHLGGKPIFYTEGRLYNITNKKLENVVRHANGAIKTYENPLSSAKHFEDYILSLFNNQKQYGDEVKRGTHKWFDRRK
ncbi:MAG: hypothetical protein FWE17_00290 [Alphaproteobacteria bacterium]|nr:hypothetical protein [Alphaproteobacteria bacterium]MCL2757751.1 hypothetical protein [Alphaproteobacteria bacterium]